MYPIIEAFTSYFPGGMFIIKKFPSKSVAAPRLVPMIITFAPISGSPVVASIILPDIFPVVPAKTCPLNRISIKLNNEAIEIIFLIVCITSAYLCVNI